MTDPRKNPDALAGLFDTDMLMSDEFSRKKRKAVADPDATTGLLQMPKTPMQRLVEEDGALKTTGKMMLNVLTGGLLSPLIHPELMGKKDQYENDMELYKKAREMDLLAQQNQMQTQKERSRHQSGLDILMNGVDDPEDAYQRLALAKEFGIDNLQYALGGGVKPNDETMTFKDFNTNYRKDTQAFSDFQDQYSTIQDGLKSESGVGDLALIFGLAKLFDPRSVVREGEVTTLQSTAGLPEQVMNMYKEVKEGRKMGPVQREQIRNYADRSYLNRLGKYDQIRERYINRGKEGFGFSNLATRLDDRAAYRGEVDAITERLAKAGMPKKDAKELAEDMVDQAMSEFTASQNPDEATYIFPNAGNR